MSREPRGWTQAALLRVYRAALIRYPRELRRRFGPDMVASAARLLDDAVRRDGALGWWRTAVRLARDLMRPLPAAVRPIPEGPHRRGGASGVLTHVLATALRSLRRDPRFTGVVLGVLCVGLALNASVLAVVNAYLLRPLPYPEADRLYNVRPSSPVGWQDVGDLFERAVSWDLDAFTLVGEAGPQLVRGAWVTPDFFELYGLQPALGRAFLPTEAGAAATSVAVVSHGLWQSRFGGDPGILGQTVQAFTSDRPEDAEVFTIVGVLPAGAWHFNGYTELLAPLRENQPVYAGRLRSDVPVGRAEDVLTQRARGQSVEAVPADFRVRLHGLQEMYVRAVRPKLLITQAAALLVLLIACANVAVLVLVRTAGRQRELAVRRALGAGGLRLVAPLVAEGAILVAGAGALGLAVASVVLPTMGSLIESRLGRGVPGGLQGLSVDLPVVVAVVGTCVALGALLALVPLYVGRSQAGGSTLSGVGRGTTDSSGARRVRSVLVGAELALSLTLLTGAGLLVRSALNLAGRDLGFDPAGLSVGQVGLRQASYPDDASRVDFYDALLTQIRELPGVDGVAAARSAPFVGDPTARPVVTEDGGLAPGIDAIPQLVTPAYFEVVGIPPSRGRGLEDDDGPGAPPVAVVSESLASSLWPDLDPVGRRLRFSEEAGAWLTVVGVVPDVVASLEGTQPTVYMAYAQAPTLWMSLVVRDRSGALGVMEQVAERVRALDQDAPVYATVDVAAAVARVQAPSRFFAGLLAVFSAFAFVLAVVGLYGVVAYAARQRRRDVAIRMALGAHGGAVQRFFLRQALVTTGVALILGVLGGQLLGDALREQLHGVSPGDPVVAVGVATLLGITALLAAWLPARSAARTDPMGVLREE